MYHRYTWNVVSGSTDKTSPQTIELVTGRTGFSVTAHIEQEHFVDNPDRWRATLVIIKDQEGWSMLVLTKTQAELLTLMGIIAESVILTDPSLFCKVRSRPGEKNKQFLRWYKDKSSNKSRLLATLAHTDLQGVAGAVYHKKRGKHALGPDILGQVRDLSFVTLYGGTVQSTFCHSFGEDESEYFCVCKNFFGKVVARATYLLENPKCGSVATPYLCAGFGEKPAQRRKWQKRSN